MANKDFSGALFRNDKKETDAHPDYRGSATIGGVEYWVSGWINTARETGKKYMSLALKAKDTPPPAAAQPAQNAEPAHEPTEDELPF